jgi:transcriptional regulator of acetoin/glycerol metabolism
MDPIRIDLRQTAPSKPAEDCAPGTHIRQVLAIAEGHSSASSNNEVASSWRRSAHAHRVDPASGEPPLILTSSELKDHRGPLEKLIADAQDELNHLYRVVREARYTVLFCNDQGVAVDHRGNQAEADQFRYWGTWLGGVWSEEVEGTNGIGTCIAEKRPITVHRTQHFRARNIALSCSGAPIFDSDGALVAILDVSSIDPQLSERSHALTGALTEASARAIEERSFRERSVATGLWLSPRPIRSTSSCSSPSIGITGSSAQIGARR